MSKFEFEVKNHKCELKSCCPKIILDLNDSGFSLKTEDGYIVIDASLIKEDGKFFVNDLSGSCSNDFVAQKQPSWSLDCPIGVTKYQIKKKERRSDNFIGTYAGSIKLGDC